MPATSALKQSHAYISLRNSPIRIRMDCRGHDLLLRYWRVKLG